MSEPLWKIRQRKGLSVNQLAAKSGVPAISISEYEGGQAIRSADLPKLARALYVEEWDIEIKSQAFTKSDTARKSPPPQRAPRPQRPKPPAPRAEPMVRPSQIEHLLNLTVNNFAKGRDILEQELGKTLEEMSRSEASELLKHYQHLLVEMKISPSPNQIGTKRRRAYLPEGVDQFELQYLTAQQEAGTQLRFTLFDGQQLSGAIIGFSPYSITILDAESQDEVTLQKLAIAYYRAVNDKDSREPDPSSSPASGDAT